jgi:carbon starvation protein
MLLNLLGNLLYIKSGDATFLHAMPLMLLALGILAIAYRYYSAFLAARVAVLDDRRLTPAHRFNDGQNYDPTNKWVLFGHHFAAISGAGPLIGPVLAIQYGYMPGLLWLVIGVCLAGAVQDMLVLAASVRHGGKSLAEIARVELGSWAHLVVSAAILFIVVIALAGLGFVVVKALGGDEISLAPDIQIKLPSGASIQPQSIATDQSMHAYLFPPGCTVTYPNSNTTSHRPEQFVIESPTQTALEMTDANTVTLPPRCKQVLPGSSWGTFTIFCTIPIALFVGLYMYRIRKGKIVEASLIGASATLAAVVIGNWVPGSALETVFSLGRGQTVWALTIYGFIASVLPVWLLLCPRDYLSSFLKIGTIALLVLGVLVANPVMKCPPINAVFLKNGPTFPGALFPFVFICIMCGAISGFHSLVSSGTTPKMIDRERQIRPIGYGAMLMEGLVGIVALFAAASLDPKLYYEINVAQEQTEKWQKQLDQLYQTQNLDPLYEQLGNADTTHLPVDRDLNQVEGMVAESLRGRTGGAVTLAVGMSFILRDAMSWAIRPESIAGLMKYWYHFAIMFEALFILTTIDAGTRIARFLLQEALGTIYKPFEKTDWAPGAILSTALVTAAWGVLVYTGSIDTIWPMFGIANQLLAVVALALVTTWMVNTGRGRYALVTILPMLFVTATTITAAAEMVGYRFPDMIASKRPDLMVKGWVSLPTTIFVVACVITLLLLAISRWFAVFSGAVPVRSNPPPEDMKGKKEMASPTA